MQVKKVHVYSLIGLLLVIFGLYLVITYLRPINNMFYSITLSIPLSFYDFYDIFQFSFGIFYVCFGIYFIFKSEINRKVEILFHIFLITIFITVLDYIPLLLQIITGTLSFAAINSYTITPYMVYYAILIGSKISVQLGVILLIYFYVKKPEFENNLLEFFQWIGVYMIVSYLNYILLIFYEAFIYSTLPTIINSVVVSLYWLSGVIFGILLCYFVKNFQDEKEISTKSFLLPINFGIFLLIGMVISIPVLEPIQIIIQIVIAVLFFILALLIHYWKKSLNEKILN